MWPLWTFFPLKKKGHCMSSNAFSSLPECEISFQKKLLMFLKKKPKKKKTKTLIGPVSKHLRNQRKSNHITHCSSASEAQRTFVTFHLMLSTFAKIALNLGKD